MKNIICKVCSAEVDSGEALNGYCDKCVEKFLAREAENAVLKRPTIPSFITQSTFCK